MSALPWVVFTPLAGALLLALIRSLKWAAWVNVMVSTITFIATLVLAFAVAEHGVLADSMFRIDAFNVYLLVLTSFIGMTTTIFSRPYMQHV